ncbi:MAG: sensor histidine kinase, partial [Actinomycetales bacterium]|nr:sensor histidine kinase [Actinomycetales bacterium]
MEGQDPSGWIGAIPASVILTVIVNAVFFGGAFWGGQVLWRDARAKAMLQQQANTIATQSEELRDQAITEERLRIARELHDVVAHHVSVIGVQAAAARRVLDRDPAAATTALANIESSSREAVTSMRGLLGTLRQIEAVPTEEGTREPEPSLEQLPGLAEAAQTPTRSVSYALVESMPGAAQRIPAPIAHSIYRTAQEALTNTAKHSTATQVSVTVRVEVSSGGASRTGSYAEVEVVDNGRPRVSATLGTGLGQLGIRERAASHRAQADIGPRATGGYRVRVRYPLADRQEEVA